MCGDSLEPSSEPPSSAIPFVLSFALYVHENAFRDADPVASLEALRRGLVMGLLEKLALTPDEVGPLDARAVLDAGVSPEAIRDAIDLCVVQHDQPGSRWPRLRATHNS